MSVAAPQTDQEVHSIIKQVFVRTDEDILKHVR